MSDHTPPASRATPEPDPQLDQAGRTMPGGIRALLNATRTLLGYGRHLVETARQRAATPAFASIAVCFGTSNLSTILAHLNRGILRAMALERVLLARAAAGRDVDIALRHRRAAAADAPPADPPSAPPPAADPPAAPHGMRRPVRRPSRPAHWNDPELFMPTLEDLEAEVRRRPIGRTIVDICLDLGVVPGFCTGSFWNEVFEIMHFFGGSLTTMARERARRRDTFCREQDRRRTSNWHWWDLGRETVRQALGFLIGEEKAAPFAPSPAPGTQAALALRPP